MAASGATVSAQPLEDGATVRIVGDFYRSFLRGGPETSVRPIRPVRLGKRLRLTRSGLGQITHPTPCPRFSRCDSDHGVGGAVDRRRWADGESLGSLMDELARPNTGNHGRCGYNARFHGYFIVLTQKNHAALYGLSVDRCLVHQKVLFLPQKLDVEPESAISKQWSWTAPGCRSLGPPVQRLSS